MLDRLRSALGRPGLVLPWRRERVVSVTVDAADYRHDEAGELPFVEGFNVWLAGRMLEAGFRLVPDTPAARGVLPVGRWSFQPHANPRVVTYRQYLPS